MLGGVEGQAVLRLSVECFSVVVRPGLGLRHTRMSVAVGRWRRRRRHASRRGLARALVRERSGACWVAVVHRPRARVIVLWTLMANEVSRGGATRGGLDVPWMGRVMVGGRSRGTTAVGGGLLVVEAPVHASRGRLF